MDETVRRNLLAIARDFDYSVAPEDQGQIVEVGYAWDEGNLFRRTIDRSEAEAFERASYSWADGADVDWDEGDDVCNGAPELVGGGEWTVLDDPETDPETGD